MKTKQIVIYHRADMDGWISAVNIITHVQAELYGWNYGDPIPTVVGYDKIYLVDLTFPKDWMLEHKKELVWIDHHKPAIEALYKDAPETKDIAGIRAFEFGACYYVSRYFMDEIVNNLTALGASYDVFDKSGKLCSWKDAWALQLWCEKAFGGIRTLNTCGRVDFGTNMIVCALALMREREISLALDEGHALEEQRKERENELWDSDAVRIVDFLYDGRIIKTAVIRVPEDARINMVIQGHYGAAELFIGIKPMKDGYRLELRESENSTLNLSTLAKDKFNGGGHPKASGGTASADELRSLGFI